MNIKNRKMLIVAVTIAILLVNVGWYVFSTFTYTYKGELVKIYDYSNVMHVDINGDEREFDYISHDYLRFCDEKKVCLSIDSAVERRFSIFEPKNIFLERVRYRIDDYVNSNPEVVIEYSRLDGVKKVTINYEKESVVKAHENRINNTYVYIDVVRKEYDSEKTPPLELEVKVNIPSKLGEEVFVVIDRKGYESQSDFPRYALNEYINLYEKIDNDRFKRFNDDFIVDKKYLEDKMLLRGNELHVIKFENEEGLNKYAREIVRFVRFDE